MFAAVLNHQRGSFTHTEDSSSTLSPKSTALDEPRRFESTWPQWTLVPTNYVTDRAPPIPSFNPYQQQPHRVQYLPPPVQEDFLRPRLPARPAPSNSGQISKPAPLRPAPRPLFLSQIASAKAQNLLSLISPPSPPNEANTAPARRTYTDEDKPFKCPVDSCGLSYRYKGDLKVHVIKKHTDGGELLANKVAKPRSTKDGKRYPCLYQNCECGYAHKRDLMRHFRSKHENAPRNIARAIKTMTDDAQSSADGLEPTQHDELVPGYIVNNGAFESVNDL